MQRISIALSIHCGGGTSPRSVLPKKRFFAQRHWRSARTRCLLSCREWARRTCAESTEMGGADSVTSRVGHGYAAAWTCGLCSCRLGISVPPKCSVQGSDWAIPPEIAANILAGRRSSPCFRGSTNRNWCRPGRAILDDAAPVLPRKHRTLSDIEGVPLLAGRRGFRILG